MVRNTGSASALVDASSRVRERDPRSFSWLAFPVSKLCCEAAELLERIALQFAPRGRQEGGMSEQWRRSS